MNEDKIVAALDKIDETLGGTNVLLFIFTLLIFVLAVNSC